MAGLRLLLPYARPYRRRLLLALLGTAAFTLLGLVPPLLTRFLVDRVVQPGRWSLLLPVAALMVLVPLVSEAVRFVNVRTLMWAGHRIIAGIRLGLYGQILGLSSRFHGRHAAGATTARLMEDVNMLLRLLTGDTVRMVVDLLVLGCSLAIAFSISVPLSLMLCAILLFYGLAYRLFARRIRRSSEAYRSLYDTIAGRLQETINGVRQVRIYNREDWENNVFTSRMAESMTHALASSMGSVNLSTACTAISGFGATAVAGVAAWMVLAGRISYGDLVAFNAYLWMAINPVVHLTTLAGQLGETFVSVRRIAGLLAETDRIPSPPGAPPVPAGPGAVEFDAVRFGYAPGRPLYRDLSLRVPAGTMVALVGPTGCGKTTLTALLMRWWDVQGGAVRVDGADVRAVDLRSLRALFGVVLQDPQLFDGTLAENIAYGRPSATRPEIERVAEACELTELARALPEGFDTLIGSDGVRFSVGEKQRVAIARAVLRNPRIMVLDEATSSLDSRSEALIQTALGRVLAGRTSFVIAHRLSTVVAADLIVVMEAGRIVETGDHTGLLAGGGLYRRLVEELRDRPAEAPA